jgi:hypothetical protein
MTYSYEKIDSLIQAIKLILSRDGHLFSVDDIELLNQCLLQLDELKEELAGAKTSEALLFEKLVNVIKLLDYFFGLKDNIRQYFES